jgi:hypothetical protein
MSNASVLRVGRFEATALVAAWICYAQVAWGQASTGNILPTGLLPLLRAQPSAAQPSAASYPQPMNTPRREPLARLIVNPDQTDGAPPFALTDQTGTIQRYVEPVPEIDLTPYVGQVIAVRNDSGTTLLASQLDLPQQPLRPMVTNTNDDRYATATRPAANSRRTSESNDVVQQVQYIDNDDASVQLLPDDVSISDPNAAPGGLMPLDGTAPGGDFPAFAEPMGQPAMSGPVYGTPYQPMPNSPGSMMAYPGPVIGPYPSSTPYSNGMGHDGFVGDIPPDRAHLSADVKLSLLRPQVAEFAAGKLSEKYELSPTIILGVRGAGNFDGRVRFWHYDRDVDVLGTDNDVHFRFNVLDIEALHRFGGRRSELTLAAGIRLAGINLTDVNDQKCGADFIGLTLAADGLTPLGCFPGGHFGLVYGGRLSILGGDWGGDDNCLFINQQVRNDNVLVNELYGGVELERRFRAADVHARLVFEMQNWKSDALAQGAFIESIGSIGFFGPGLQLGAEF